MKTEIKITKNAEVDDLYDIDTTQHHMNPYHEVGFIEIRKDEPILIPSGFADLTIGNLKTIAKFMEKLTKAKK